MAPIETGNDNEMIPENISKAVSKDYLAVGLPQINVDGGLKYNYEVQKSLIDISRFMPGVPEGTEQEVQFGQTYEGRFDFNIDQMIFNGSYFVGLSATKIEEKIQDSSVLAGKRQMLLDSIKKFGESLGIDRGDFSREPSAHRKSREDSIF